MRNVVVWVVEPGEHHSGGFCAHFVVVDRHSGEGCSPSAASLALNEGPAIRVNAVAPGPILSPMWTMQGGLADTFAAVHGVHRDESIEVEMKVRGRPLARIGTAEEVANVVVFLASDLASYSPAPSTASTAARSARSPESARAPGAPLQQVGLHALA